LNQSPAAGRCCWHPLIAVEEAGQGGGSRDLRASVAAAADAAIEARHRIHYGQQQRTVIEVLRTRDKPLHLVGTEHNR
jgi:hypothetical protein